MIHVITQPAKRQRQAEQGFTLIELSIVLVIIGLIVGGVLVGQDLIRAAEVRATISQVEKYNTAVNTFRGKYNALPGDMPASVATAFGFIARGTAAGEGDGNGVIECYNATTNSGFCQAGGETGLFWVDLSTGGTGSQPNLIDGGFSSAAITVTTAVTSSNLANYLPAAKLGRGNYLYVWSTGGTNYYGLSVPSAIASSTGVMTSAPSLSVQQAYNIDKKVDDGIPLTGNVTANYVTGSAQVWSVNPTAGISGDTTTTSITAASTTCYDNAATVGNNVAYSLAQNNGAGANCALSFRFQ